MLLCIFSASTLRDLFIVYCISGLFSILEFNLSIIHFVLKYSTIITFYYSIHPLMSVVIMLCCHSHQADFHESSIKAFSFAVSFVILFLLCINHSKSLCNFSLLRFRLWCDGIIFFLQLDASQISFCLMLNRIENVTIYYEI